MTSGNNVRRVVLEGGVVKHEPPEAGQGSAALHSREQRFTYGEVGAENPQRRMWVHPGVEHQTRLGGGMKNSFRGDANSQVPSEPLICKEDPRAGSIKAPTHILRKSKGGI